MKIFLKIFLVVGCAVVASSGAIAQDKPGEWPPDTVFKADAAGNLQAVRLSTECTPARLIDLLRVVREEFVPEVKSMEEVRINQTPAGERFIVHPRAYYLDDSKQWWGGEMIYKGVPLNKTPEALRREAEEKTKQADMLDRKLKAVQEINEIIRICTPPAPPPAPKQ